MVDPFSGGTVKILSLAADVVAGFQKRMPLPLAALIGAVAGMYSCRRAFEPTMSAIDGLGRDGSAIGLFVYRVFLAGPFVLGALVTTTVIWLLTWNAKNTRPAGAIPASFAAMRTGTTVRPVRATGALYVFLWISAIASTMGAVIGSLLSGDTIAGGLIGLGLGALLSLPAAVMVWVVRRGRAD
jgi:hypothetical protein